MNDVYDYHRSPYFPRRCRMLGTMTDVYDCQLSPFFREYAESFHIFPEAKNILKSLASPTFGWTVYRVHWLGRCLTAGGDARYSIRRCFGLISIVIFPLTTSGDEVASGGSGSNPWRRRRHGEKKQAVVGSSNACSPTMYLQLCRLPLLQFVRRRTRRSPRNYSQLPNVLARLHYLHTEKPICLCMFYILVVLPCHHY